MIRGPVGAVVAREYLIRVRTRGFVLTTLLVPVLAVGVIVLPLLLSGEGGGAELVTVVDRTGRLYEPVREALAGAGWEVARGDPATPAEVLEARVGEAREGSVLLLDDGALSRGRAVWLTAAPPGPLRRATVQGAVVTAAIRARLGEAAPGVEELLAGGEIEVRVLGDGTADPEDPAFLSVYVGAFALYMVILLYAGSVMRSTLEEKTSRMVEVVLSAVRPWELMLGKVVGVGAVGLTQLALWLALGAAGVLVALPVLEGARPGVAEGVAGVLPGPGYLALFLAFFLGGYFLYGALYAAVGALVSSEQEAQQVQVPVVFLLVLPILFLSRVIAAPDAGSSVALSFVPFFTPILMFARAVAGGVPAWQLALSLAGVVGAVALTAWVAGRIYRVGILMTGKRPTLPEIWRWIRAGS